MTVTMHHKLNDFICVLFGTTLSFITYANIQEGFKSLAMGAIGALGAWIATKLIGLIAKAWKQYFSKH